MEIKDFIDHLQFGKFFVYVIDKEGLVISKTEYQGENDIYFVSADMEISYINRNLKIIKL